MSSYCLILCLIATHINVFFLLQLHLLLFYIGTLVFYYYLLLKSFFLKLNRLPGPLILNMYMLEQYIFLCRNAVLFTETLHNGHIVVRDMRSEERFFIITIVLTSPLHRQSDTSNSV